jgi:hypothetical protein
MFICVYSFNVDDFVYRLFPTCFTAFFESWWVMYIDRDLSPFEGAVVSVIFFLGEAGGLSGICLVFRIHIAGDMGPCVVHFAGLHLGRTLLHLLFSLGLVTSRPKRPYTCWPAYFLISFKVEFVFVDSFIIFICGCYCGALLVGVGLLGCSMELAALVALIASVVRLVCVFPFCRVVPHSFFFISSKVELGVVASFVDSGCYCDLLGSWHCNMSNLFFVRIVKSEAFYRLHVFAFSSLFVLGGVLFLVCAFLVAL